MHGTEDDLTFTLGNFKGEVIDDTLFALQNYITSNKLSKTLLYLMPEKKLEQTHKKSRSQTIKDIMTTESDFDEDFVDIFTPIFPSDISSNMESTSSNLL